MTIVGIAALGLPIVDPARWALAKDASILLLAVYGGFFSGGYATLLLGALVGGRLLRWLGEAWLRMLFLLGLGGPRPQLRLRRDLEEALMPALLDRIADSRDLATEQEYRRIVSGSAAP